MKITKQFNWFMVFEGSDDHQFLYHIDRPIYKFKQRKVQRGSETVVIADRKPSWNIISIELPTRPIKSMVDWLEQQDERNFMVMCYTLGNELVESWLIKGARIIRKRVVKGRRIDTNVVCVQVCYDWFGKKR
jgi:hypothetical protein